MIVLLCSTSSFGGKRSTPYVAILWCSKYVRLWKSTYRLVIMSARRSHRVMLGTRYSNDSNINIFSSRLIAPLRSCCSNNKLTGLFATIIYVVLQALIRWQSQTIGLCKSGSISSLVYYSFAFEASFLLIIPLTILSISAMKRIDKSVFESIAITGLTSCFGGVSNLLNFSLEWGGNCKDVFRYDYDF